MTEGRGMTASELVGNILRGILPRPDSFTVREELVGENGRGVTVVVVVLPSEQARFCIGRNGSTADGIRTVLKAWSGLHGRAAYLKVIESDSRESDGRTYEG